MYKFNQEIIDALKNKTTVYYAVDDNDDCWIEINSGNYILLGGVIDGKWSLTKPKPKVTKTIERYINIYLIEGMIFEGEAFTSPRKFSGHEDGEFITTVKLTGTYEVEE